MYIDYIKYADAVCYKQNAEPNNTECFLGLTIVFAMECLFMLVKTA